VVPGTVTIRPDGTPGGAPVCLVVPSVVHVLQAAWLADLGRGSRLHLAGWLAAELAADEQADDQPDDQPPRLRPWRYDVAVADLVRQVGADGVVLVTGHRRAVEAALDGLGLPGLSSDVAWPRLLDPGEVALVGSWLEQLGELGLTGPVATDLVGRCTDRLPTSAAAAVASGSPALPAEPAGAVERRTREMAAAVRDSGVRVLGDADELLWPAEAAESAAPTVPTSTATGLAIGVLERALEWAPLEHGVRR
jgi:hypothetical protein